jgi:large subunit ribosomal protein L18
MALTKLKRRKRIKMRIRKHVSGTEERPRMTVFRSNKEMYVQLVDDLNGKTLLLPHHSKRMRKKQIKRTRSNRQNKLENLSRRNLLKRYYKVVFDRNGYLYHGRVKALADAAREGGLKF